MISIKTTQINIKSRLKFWFIMTCKIGLKVVIFFTLIGALHGHHTVNFARLCFACLHDILLNIAHNFDTSVISKSSAIIKCRWTKTQNFKTKVDVAYCFAMFWWPWVIPITSGIGFYTVLIGLGCQCVPENTSASDMALWMLLKIRKTYTVHVLLSPLFGCGWAGEGLSRGETLLKILGAKWAPKFWNLGAHFNFQGPTSSEYRFAKKWDEKCRLFIFVLSHFGLCTL